jgi:hypothetical protein
MWWWLLAVGVEVEILVVWWVELDDWFCLVLREDRCLRLAIFSLLTSFTQSIMDP